MFYMKDNSIYVVNNDNIEVEIEVPTIVYTLKFNIGDNQLPTCEAVLKSVGRFDKSKPIYDVVVNEYGNEGLAEYNLKIPVRFDGYGSSPEKAPIGIFTVPSDTTIVMLVSLNIFTEDINIQMELLNYLINPQYNEVNREVVKYMYYAVSNPLEYKGNLINDAMQLYRETKPGNIKRS